MKRPDVPPEIVEKVRRWLRDPVEFVRDEFKVEPHLWQAQALRLLPISLRLALSACKGPGKTAVLAWAGWWILACHENAQGGALAITQDNLKTNLWKELAYWYEKSAFLKMSFEFNAKSITSKLFPRTWKLEARSFAQTASENDQASTLAGLHGPFPFWLLDEIGDMPIGVIGAAKGIFYVQGQRGWIVAAGNPTSHDGALYHCVHVEPEQWEVIHITGDPDDPNRSPNINIEQARLEIAALGRDNPWVLVNILGKFPPQGSNQLLSVDDVIAAMKRDMPVLTYLSDPIIWGLDPARSDKSGADEAALARRQGLLARRFLTWRGQDGTQLGDQVAHMLNRPHEWGGMPDALFVDVGGIGSSAYDRLVHLGYGDLVIPTDFGSSAMESGKYHNLRTEIWVKMADWIKSRPACLPNDPDLRRELTSGSPRCHYRVISKATKFILESKDQMKERGAKSPNKGDALGLTFTAPVAHRSRAAREQTQRCITEYNPLVGV